MLRTSTRTKTTLAVALDTPTKKSSPLKSDAPLPAPLSTPRRATRSSISISYKGEEIKIELPEVDAYMTPIKKTPVKNTLDSFKTKGETPTGVGLSPAPVKKLANLDRMVGVSPYPEMIRPTPEECQEVYARLCKGHGVPVRPKVFQDQPNAIAGCGQTPDVLDALIRTTLSQNTTSFHSTNAKNAMDRVCGRAEYRTVLEGGEEMLQETIRCGGLAKVKAKSIVKILRRLDERQQGKGQLTLDYLHKMVRFFSVTDLLIGGDCSCGFDVSAVR
ncbi:hypothetical protein, variant [Microbotryum lychnidis-dioicae p1A1 Lamole]|uniref:HhH-GPD domain-containing protein n=1 Tax=Microbotryum lychnidis-dioicae (strain p1A1 Lamole / MvSl-1064) TaxID=683840 RepID=U5HJK6_USTV1|nr:hypothetical protein MVLG_07187 [Microbotryum lychnidis-dioicae p1A1 Lamole]KDE02246.1 hypothetical protein, variant [Microbotryum lychnidis-dioicae p1A1 Lamole]|eukprot:KDE02245.1 hypothetical protein MVLG_07187 [Microbotryum lychnidis-dioicae p1A1 Lamole]